MSENIKEFISIACNKIGKREIIAITALGTVAFIYDSYSKSFNGPTKEEVIEGSVDN